MKNKVFQMRMSEKELEKWKEQAELHNMPLAAYIRYLFAKEMEKSNAPLDKR